MAVKLAALVKLAVPRFIFQLEFKSINYLDCPS